MKVTPTHHVEGEVSGSQMNRSQRKIPQVHAISGSSKSSPGVPEIPCRDLPTWHLTGTSCAESSDNCNKYFILAEGEVVMSTYIRKE